MYATTTSGHQTNVTKNKDSKVLQLLYFFVTIVGVIIQDTETTTEEWFGLSYSDANSLCVSSETSTLNGTTRSYLGNAKLLHNTLGGGWCMSPSCWGTKVTTSINRMSDTNLYHVVRTTTVYTVRGSGQNVILELE